jgi:hypothetical protein
MSDSEKRFAAEMRAACMEGKFKGLERSEQRLLHIEQMAGGPSEFQAWILGGTMRMTIWITHPGFYEQDPPERYLVCATPMNMAEDGVEPPDDAQTRSEDDKWTYDGNWTPTHWVEIGDLLRGYISGLISMEYSPGNEKDRDLVVKQAGHFCKAIRDAVDEIEQDLPIALARYAEIRAARVQALGGYIYPDKDEDDGEK